MSAAVTATFVACGCPNKAALQEEQDRRVGRQRIGQLQYARSVHDVAPRTRRIECSSTEGASSLDGLYASQFDHDLCVRSLNCVGRGLPLHFFSVQVPDASNLQVVAVES